MGLRSNTGLLPTVIVSSHITKHEQPPQVDIKCSVTPAPFTLRPYASLYNPFSHSCSILCNHPTDAEAKQFVKRIKDGWSHDGKMIEDAKEPGTDRDVNKAPYDIVTEDMLRRYTETDSRPLTPAPTLASGKSRGSRRCLTPDQPHQKTSIVLDLRRSHSQETIYYHGYTTSELTVGPATSGNDGSTLPSLTSEGINNRLKGQCEQLPSLASPLVLTKRSLPAKDAGKSVRKAQLKALNLGKGGKGKKAAEPVPVTQRSNEKENDGSEAGIDVDEGGGGDSRRRGKRRRKGRQSDRLTSAGLAAQAQQDPETQVAGIGTDSQNNSSRGSIVPKNDDDSIILPLPAIKTGPRKKTDSFLDDDMLKYLHREVDEEAIEMEFNTKRRYVLEEALRTRPEKSHGVEMQALLRDLKVPAISLGDWLHIPRVFSRRNAVFALPIDTNELENLSPMKYAARYVTIKKSKQLLYMTVLRKIRAEGYRMPIECIEEGLILMMGGTLTAELAAQFKYTMDWESYEEEENLSDDVKLTLLDDQYKKNKAKLYGDVDVQWWTHGALPLLSMNGCSIKYRTWCGVCAICERVYGRFPQRSKDLPDGFELSDFSLLETKLPSLNVHSGLVEILNTIRIR